MRDNSHQAQKPLSQKGSRGSWKAILKHRQNKIHPKEEITRVYEAASPLFPSEKWRILKSLSPTEHPKEKTAIFRNYYGTALEKKLTHKLAKVV